MNFYYFIKNGRNAIPGKKMNCTQSRLLDFMLCEDVCNLASGATVVIFWNLFLFHESAEHNDDSRLKIKIIKNFIEIYAKLFMAPWRMMNTFRKRYESILCFLYIYIYIYIYI